jgi:hypothetical protein
MDELSCGSIITMTLAVLEFMPQVSLYKLLRALEAQAPGAAQPRIP